MAEMMYTNTNNSTSNHFGMGHMCTRHQCLYDLHHIKVCDQLTGVERIPEFAKMVKEIPFVEWDKQLKLQTVGPFALLFI